MSGDLIIMGKWLGRNYAHHCPYITHTPNPSLAYLQHSLLNKPISLQSLSSPDILCCFFVYIQLLQVWCQHWRVRCQRWSVRCQRWSVLCQRWSVRCQRWSVRCQRWFSPVSTLIEKGGVPSPLPLPTPASLATSPPLPTSSPLL
jgi:hypothetical protein